MGTIWDRFVNLLPRPVFLGLAAVLGITFVFWRLETRPGTLLAYDFLRSPLYLALVASAVLAVPAYYLISHLLRRPQPTAPGRVGVWLAELEGDAERAYLRDLKGQVERELSEDSALRDVEVRLLPRVLDDHDEARKTGVSLNAGAVVWGSVGRGLDERGVSNLKLTVIGGPMDLRNDVQFRAEVDLAGYETHDVARFVTGYGLLSGGRPVEAAVHFDRILEAPRPGLFVLSDALQFGGIACFLATNETTDSRELLEKAERYFTAYRDLWSEERGPKPRAMGLYNLGGVHARKSAAGRGRIEEALRCYGEAARMFDAASHGEGYAMARIAEAHIFSDLYQARNEVAYGTRAYATLEDAARHITKDDLPDLWGKLQFERGRLLIRMAHAFAGYYEDAVAALEEALECYRAIGYPLETASALLFLGAARHGANAGAAGRAEALDVYGQALTVAPKERFPGVYAEIQSSRSFVLAAPPTTPSDLRAAVGAAEEALSVLRPGENPVRYARARILHAEACLAYSSSEGVSDEEAASRLGDGLRSAESALGVVSPSFYPDYHARADFLAGEAREKLEDRERAAEN